MAQFTEKQQKAHRDAFIEEARLKAWGAACHAGWIEKSLNELIAHYQKLQAEDKAIEAEIKANLDSLDGHTVANRNKRAELQKKRTNIAQQMKLIATNTQQGAASMQKLIDSREQNLLLAEHAKDWSWLEVEEPKEVPAEAAAE